MMKRHKDSEKGFSLVETVVGIGLFAVALFGIVSLIAFSLNMSDFSQNRMDAADHGRRVLEGIRKEIDRNTISTARAISDWPAQVGLSPLPLDGESVIVTISDPFTSDPVEVKVTIMWTEKGKSVSYDVNTLMTDRAPA
jgi:type II secretory pathway pseudopilin PulG